MPPSRTLTDTCSQSLLKTGVNTHIGHGNGPVCGFSSLLMQWKPPTVQRITLYTSNRLFCEEKKTWWQDHVSLFSSSWCRAFYPNKKLVPLPFFPPLCLFSLTLCCSATVSIFCTCFLPKPNPSTSTRLFFSCKACKCFPHLSGTTFQNNFSCLCSVHVYAFTLIFFFSFSHMYTPHHSLFESPKACHSMPPHHGWSSRQCQREPEFIDDNDPAQLPCDQRHTGPLQPPI